MKKILTFTSFCLSIVFSNLGLYAFDLPDRITQEDLPKARRPLPPTFKVENHLFLREFIPLAKQERYLQENKDKFFSLRTLKFGKTSKGLSHLMFNILHEGKTGENLSGRIEIYGLNDNIVDDNLLKIINYKSVGNIDTSYRGAVSYRMEYAFDSENKNNLYKNINPKILIPNIDVIEAHRKKGFAESLLREALDFAKNNTKADLIGAACVSQASVALFEKCGFSFKDDGPRVCGDKCGHYYTIKRQAE